jgi:hypothetical protein
LGIMWDTFHTEPIFIWIVPYFSYMLMTFFMIVSRLLRPNVNLEEENGDSKL